MNMTRNTLRRRLLMKPKTLDMNLRRISPQLMQQCLPQHYFPGPRFLYQVWMAQIKSWPSKQHVGASKRGKGASKSPVSCIFERLIFFFSLGLLTKWTLKEEENGVYFCEKVRTYGHVWKQGTVFAKPQLKERKQQSLDRGPWKGKLNC
jgi:hypothetical protein